jgi:HAD superfamily hydrolase (TIGR01509 family)
MTWPAACLFDMDGLLVDSEPLWTVAEQELAVSLGGTWTADLKAAVIGTSITVAVPVILDWFGASDRDPVEVEEWLLGRMVELFRDRLTLRPGARELLRELHGIGMPMALVSSSYRILVEAGLDVLGRSPFRATVAGDEVTHTKPHPEPYLTACARLGVDPVDAVVFEDSPTGVRAGEAAGCFVIAVPDYVSVQPGPRTRVVDSLADLDASALSELAVR